MPYILAAFCRKNHGDWSTRSDVSSICKLRPNASKSQVFHQNQNTRARPETFWFLWSFYNRKRFLETCFQFWRCSALLFCPFWCKTTSFGKAAVTFRGRFKWRRQNLFCKADRGPMPITKGLLRRTSRFRIKSETNLLIPAYWSEVPNWLFLARMTVADCRCLQNK